MARFGRRFPLGTQYVFTPLEPASGRVAGNVNFLLTSTGRVRVHYRVFGTATFHLNATGTVSAKQKVKGSALFALHGSGAISLLAGGGTATQFVQSFIKASEAIAGLAMVEEYPPTHPYLQAMSVAFKELALQGEPVTIGPTGVANKLAKFTGPTQVGDSAISEVAGVVSVAGHVDVSGTYRVAGTAVVGTRKTGYAAMTGTANRGTVYATGTITLVQLAERVKALQDDHTLHGLIGA